jgi:hypothetical protein
MTKAYIWFLTMVIASLCLSVVSGLETFLGLRNFMPQGFIGVIFAMIFTFAVQALLFVISWRIAEHLLEPWRSQALSFTAWFICAVFSGYFSYFGFFQQIGGRDENTRVNAVQVAQADILRQIDADIEEDLRAQHQQALLDNGTYETWVEGLENLIEVAEQAETEIEIRARQREGDLTAQRVGLQQELELLQEDRIAADAARQSAERTREALRERIVRLETSTTALADQIVEAEAAVEGLRTQLEVEGRTGQGPRFRQIEIDLGSAEAALAQLRIRLERATAELAQSLEDRVRSDLAAQQDIEGSRLNDVLGEIDRVEARIAGVTAEIEGVRAAATLDFGAERQVLSERLSRLRQLDYAAYDEMIGRCEEISRQITQAGLGDRVSAVRCNYSELAPVLADLRERQSRRDEFRAVCSDGRARVIRSEDGPPQIDGIVEQLQNTCVAYAVSPDLEEDIGREIANIAKTRGDEALVFDRASVALFTDWQSNAVMSALFAIVVDLLVLLCALMGRNAGQPETVRAIDRVVAGLSLPEGEERQYFARRYKIPAEGNERAMVQQVLLKLLSEELAVRADTDPDEPEVLLLRKGAIERLKQWRADEMRGTVVEVRPPSAAQNRNNRRRT